MTSCGQEPITNKYIATHTKLTFKETCPLTQNSHFITAAYSSYYTNATSTFITKALCLVSNVQLLEFLIQWNEQFIQPYTYVFLHGFPTTHFISKAMPIITIDFVHAAPLCKLTKDIRTCSTSYIGSIYVNALRGRHTSVLIRKNNFPCK